MQCEKRGQEFGRTELVGSEVPGTRGATESPLTLMRVENIEARPIRIGVGACIQLRLRSNLYVRVVVVQAHLMALSFSGRLEPDLCKVRKLSRG